MISPRIVRNSRPFHSLHWTMQSVIISLWLQLVFLTLRLRSPQMVIYFLFSWLLSSKRAEGLKREWNGFSVLELPLTWTQEHKTSCPFIPGQKHYIGRLFNSNGSIASCLISCQLRLAREAAGASLQSASSRIVGSSAVSWGLLPSLTTFSSSLYFPNKKLHQTGRIYWIKLCWRCLHQYGRVVIVIWSVFFYLKKLSEQCLRNCCDNLGCPGCVPALNNTPCCHGTFVTPWARTWLAARSFSPQVLHLETPDVHRACTGEVESLSKWFKTEKGNREMLAVHEPCRVHLGGNKSRKILAVFCSCQCWTNAGIFKKYWLGNF